MSWHKEQLGFVTFAQNTSEVNYLELAYLQALNIKATQKQNKYAVIVDAATKEQLNEDHYSVFDYVIDLPVDHNDPSSAWKLANEFQVFRLTPFKETIKVEADLLFTRSIDHWITAFRLRNVLLSTGCRDYQGRMSTSRKYRQFFDDNHLPDVYNGLMYFRFSQEAVTFFKTCEQILANWPTLRDQVLLNCREETPSTDVLYALAAHIVGLEICTAPGLDFINFTHMKPAINGYAEDLTFQESFVTEQDGNMIRVNNINQLHPFHYHEKDYGSRILKSS